jgi:hypothetical protein
MKWFVVLGFVLSGAIYGMAFFQRPAPKPGNPGTVTSGSRKAVIVELFTSEGCSSCPPADELLRELVVRQPAEGVEIVAFGNHVDYWDRLGWRDPFSSDWSTKRQYRYAQRFDSAQVYTPQAVVAGADECLGSNRSAILSLVENAARATTADVSLTLKPGGKAGKQPIEVQISKLPRRTEKVVYEVLLAITEDELSTDVRRGENAGRKLRHAPVTRKVVQIGDLTGDQVAVLLPATLELDNGWNHDHLRLTAFVQEKAGLKIVGAATMKLGK